MADAQTTRFTMEVLAAAPESAGVTRQGIQVALERPGANSSATAAVARYSMEVLAEFPDTAKVTRQGLQVALERPGANSAATAAVARFSQEVLAQTPPKASVTRQGLQVALARPGANLTANAGVTRFSLEVLARSFLPMTTFSIPAGWEFFLHNWAKKSSLESTYSTDITASAEDVAEERTALLQKPWRALSCQWAVKGGAETNQMLTELRRLVDETSVIPLYMHARQVTTAVDSLDTTVYSDFSTGHWFQNGPVVIFSFKPTKSGENIQVDSYVTKVISSRFDDRLVLTGAVGSDFPAGRTYVMPLMQVHPQTEVEVSMLTNTLLRIDISFDEIYGSTALPPTFTDLPPNYDSYNDYPILSTVPQWSDGVMQRLKREGSQDALGRGRVVYQRGARHRVMHSLRFQENRTIAWDLIRFFDSRRGRLIPFWVIDFDNIYTVALISNPNLTVSSSIGTLAEFQAEMDYIGVIFSDGTTAVRRASAIVDVGGAWRITMDDNLPAGYTEDDVVAFGRARLCRMEEDALKEDWETTEVCTMEIPVIELLAEQEVTP